MKPRIETLEEKRLMSIGINMSFAQDRTRELWQRFMPRRGEIGISLSSALYSVEVYPPQFFERFDPHALFQRWAAVEVADFGLVPKEMEALTIPAGLYAVFLHQGSASEAERTYQYIFNTWMPNAPFLLDNRPHFAVMGDKYKGDDPDSEEELWIPIKPKESIRI